MVWFWGYIQHSPIGRRLSIIRRNSRGTNSGITIKYETKTRVRNFLLMVATCSLPCDNPFCLIAPMHCPDRAESARCVVLKHGGAVMHAHPGDVLYVGG
jgi:hypothetical protein